MNRVLIITYYWPPSGGAGVQRWLKLSKYLPQYGWQPVILTVDPDYASYPAIDKTLAAEIPASVRIEKTKATNWFSIYGKSKVPAAGFAKNNDDKLSGKISRFIRGNFFIPDPRRGWNRYAFRKACEIIEKEGIRNVITTSPPHSTQLIGLKIRKKYPDLKWIADLRDPWTDIYYYRNFYPSFIAKAIDRHYEKRVLSEADQIITVGNSLMNILGRKSEGINKKTEIIYNGYDPEDFKGITPVKQATFTISYTGTISPAYPVSGFLEAISALNEKGMKIRLRFTGEISSELKTVIKGSEGSFPAEFISYADHKTAISNMAGSSALLLIIPDHESSKSIITGKLFEYLATGLPVICLGPENGDAAMILEKYGNGKTFDYYDSDGILKLLEEIYSGNFTCTVKSHDDIRRDLQAKKLASLLEKQTT